MKNIVFALSIIGLTACGTAKNNNDSSELASAKASANSSPEKMLFSRDLRPVDGKLAEIALVKNSDGKYDATLRTAFFNRTNGQAVDETKEIASGLACQITASKVSCESDRRPVDGYLKVLVIKKSGDTYDATLRSAFFDRVNGKAVDETKEITSELILHAPAQNQADSLVFSRDLRPVDGSLSEIKVLKNSNGTYDASLRVAYFDRLNGQSVDQTKDIATGMACKTSKDAKDKLSKISCSVDQRPVDGALNELTIKRQKDGSFTASLRTAFFDRIQGKYVDETKELASDLKLN